MTKFSYHVSHEQFAPSELLALVRHAEAAGFDAAFASDHVQPWTPEQGQSGLVWAWLGAALQATQRIAFGAITIPGGWRYHPVILAQGIATLSEMFPGRLPWIALGSGEALNECVAGAPWPRPAARNARLREGAQIIRELLAGKTVTREGPPSAENARLWPRPERPPQLVAAAMSEPTAEWAGTWADGLLTIAPTVEKLAGIVDAFRRHGAEKPVHVKVDVSWAPTDAEALAQAYDQWRVHALEPSERSALRSPEQYAAAAREVRPEDLRKVVLISSDLSRHIDWLQDRAALGFSSLDIHNVGRNQREFLDAFGERVLPALRP